MSACFVYGQKEVMRLLSDAQWCMSMLQGGGVQVAFARIAIALDGLQYLAALQHIMA